MEQLLLASTSTYHHTTSSTAALPSSCSLLYPSPMKAQMTWTCSHMKKTCVIGAVSIQHIRVVSLTRQSTAI